MGYKKVGEKSRVCHNHKPQPFPDTNRKRKPTNPNKHMSNKRTKSTKPALGGVCSLTNYSVAYEETQSNRVSDFRGFVCSLLSKPILFLLLFMYINAVGDCVIVISYLSTVVLIFRRIPDITIPAMQLKGT